MNSNIDQLTENFESLKIDSNNIVGYVFDEKMLLHKEFSNTHPEKPERAMVIYSNLLLKRYTDKLVRIDTHEITEEETKLIHHQEYISNIENLQFDNNSDGSKSARRKYENKYSLCYDTYDNYHTYESAKISAGCLLSCCKSIVDQKVNQAFAIIRPPGHHASANECRGFCFFNNVAISVEYLIKQGLNVAIVDWDVHHGDGTQEIFYNRKNPLFISVHRHDNGAFYPNKTGKSTEIGEGPGKGYNINIPWNNKNYKIDKSFIGDDEYFYAFENIIIPVLKEYKPDIIIVSCGFDAAENDPLGKMSLTPIGYSYMTHALRKLCDKVLIALEGGYNLDSLSRCSESIIRTLLGEEKPFNGLLLKKEISDLNLTIRDLSFDFFSPSKRIISDINNIKKLLIPYWKSINFESENQKKEKVEENLVENEEIYNLKSFIIDKQILNDSDFLIFKLGSSKLDQDDKYYKRKINTMNRTTTSFLNYRINGIRLSEITKDSYLYNWKGKEGCYNVHLEEMSIVVSKFLKYKKIKKENLLEKLTIFLVSLEKILLDKIDLYGCEIVIYLSERQVKKISSTRSKVELEPEIKFKDIKMKNIVPSSSLKFITAFKNIINYIQEEII